MGRKYKRTFDAKTIEELFYQVVGCASSCRFWDELPTSYPGGAGTFREDVAKELAEDAIAHYRKLSGKD